MQDKPIIVIGGGIGGLSAAIRLAIAGKRVIILEKNAQVGGKMGQVAHDGFRWDTGPSVITMRHVFADLFHAAGRNFDDYVKLIPIEPLTRYFYPDGTRLDAHANLSKMATEIDKLNPRDVEGYLSYLAYTARIHRITGPVFIYDHPPRLNSFRRVPPNEWLKVDPFRTMHGSIKRFVRHPHLRQMLGRFATYVGGSPYEAPATLNVIAHVELTGGVWYAQGGIYKIAEAMAKLADELGVEICTNTPVESILTQDGRTIGVKTQDGKQFDAAAVIANVDVTTTYKHLLTPTSAIQKRLAALEAYEPSCSGLIMLWGVEGQHSDLAHHNIFFSANYEAEFRDIFKLQTAPQDPTIYVAITSKADASHAPEGGENWFVLVNMPASPLKLDVTAYKEHVLAKLAKFGYDVRGKIRTETLYTPQDLEQMTGAWRGALYGPSGNSKWTAFRRPHNRAKEVKGLYFAGGTTHPGGGVPMVTLSGKVAAELVLEDLGL